MGLGIVEDGFGRPIFAGWRCSDDFPSSYIGGWRDDSVFALALAEPDRVVVGGETYSPDGFPTTSNAFDETHNSPHQAYDVFVMDLLTPRCCTLLSGTTDPWMLMPKAVDGNCPQGTPEGQLIDLAEGELENVDRVDVGEVWGIACNSPRVVFGTDISPAPGFALFQIARFKPDGSYVDGAETSLVGARTIVAGDSRPADAVSSPPGPKNLRLGSVPGRASGRV